VTDHGLALRRAMGAPAGPGQPADLPGITSTVTVPYGDRPAPEGEGA
jgi:hypothetical protein